MLAAERRARIVDEVRQGGMVSTEHLSQRLDVSIETIRRDLMRLEDDGLLSRVHGGAAADLAGRRFGQEASFSDRDAGASAAKERIAAAAAGLVHSGQVIMIDVGTTALRVARALPGEFEGTVVTCSLLVAVELAGRRGVEVLICGGRVREGDLAVTNTVAERFFADLNPDVAFLGSGGVDPHAGLTDFHLDESVVRRTVVRNAHSCFVLADSSKFGRVAPHRVCGLDEVSGLITDREPPADLTAAVTQRGGRLIVG